MKSTRRYFSYEFLIDKHKFNGNYITVLQQIYEWMFSNTPPKQFVENKKTFFYISQSYLSRMNAGICSQQYISKIFKRFKEIGLILETKILNNNKEYYVAFDWNVVKQTLYEDKEINMKYSNNWFEKINAFADSQLKAKNSYNNKSEENKMPELLSEDEMNQKVYYCKQSDAIAKAILKRKAQFFSTQFPKEGQKPSKTYIRLCRKIEDIFNGHFLSSRFYSFNENVFNNKQFNTEGWREKIKSVKGDWKKVRQLIFNAVENFVLMYDENRMPLKKDYLTTSLNDWFFSDNPNSKGQSQFIQSLNEPEITKQKFSEDKAKKIIVDLKEKSPVSYLAGHELNELLPAKASELAAWNYIREIIKWGKLLWQFEPNARYFMECEIDGKLEAGAKVLPALFARYLKEKQISVSLNTLNIREAVESNAPWSWFIKDACSKHSMNPDFLYCFNDNDFFDAYNKNKKEFENDEMEIPIF